jgi:hypothetical protein
VVVAIGLGWWWFFGKNEPPQSSEAVCGDGQCELDLGENCTTCLADCDILDINQNQICATCGNGVCEGAEISGFCPEDCDPQPSDPCGNGTCEVNLGESCTTCLADCDILDINQNSVCATCGNGVCEGAEVSGLCPEDCDQQSNACGNGTCEVNLGESCTSCLVDCDILDINQNSVCATCGNGVCEGAEISGLCPEDCDQPASNTCGNGTCEVNLGESCTSCLADCDILDINQNSVCATCGNGVCEGAEISGLCPEDCDQPTSNVCGDGVVGPGEQCDGSDLTQCLSTQSCSDSCQCIFVVQADVTPDPQSLCGNGLVDAVTEQCDPPGSICGENFVCNDSCQCDPSAGLYYKVWDCFKIAPETYQWEEVIIRENGEKIVIATHQGDWVGNCPGDDDGDGSGDGGTSRGTGRR